MTPIEDILILSGNRTAIGSFGGSLSGLSPADLGTVAAKAAIGNAGVDATAIDHAVFGHIITTAPQDAYLARHIALNAGLAQSSAAMNVNRLFERSTPCAQLARNHILTNRMSGMAHLASEEKTMEVTV